MTFFRTFVAASLTAVAFGANAQVTPGNTNVNCSFSDLTNVTVSACTGFNSGNELAGAYLEKIASLGGSDTLNFAASLSGMTTIGLHFGAGADLFKDAVPAYDGTGGGTAYYTFNADGVDAITISALLAKASSGAALISTGGPVVAVPEPSTYALMLAGLAGVGFIARRRKA